MAVLLKRGGNVAFDREAPTLRQARIGIGWGTADGGRRGPVEFDSLLVLVGADNHAMRDGGLRLLNEVPGPPAEGSAEASRIVGDADKVVVNLADVPEDVERLVFAVAIFDAVGRRQNFGAVRGAYIRVVDHANGNEVARYEVEKATGLETAMEFGELYRYRGGWRFRAVGQGYTDGVRGLARQYGVAL